MVASDYQIAGSANHADDSRPEALDPALPLTRVFQRQNIQVLSRARDKETVIQELVQSLADQNLMDPTSADAIADKLLLQEDFGSSAIGKGLAFPTLRTSEVQDFAGAVAIIPEGVDFHAVDHAPTKLVFLTLSPIRRRNQHIGLLNRLASLIRDKAVCSYLQHATSGDDVYQYLADLDGMFPFGSSENGFSTKGPAVTRDANPVETQPCLSIPLPHEVKKELFHVDSKSKVATRDCVARSRDCDSRSGDQGHSHQAGNRGTHIGENPKIRTAGRKSYRFWNAIQSWCREAARKLRRAAICQESNAYGITASAFSLQGTSHRQNEDRDHVSSENTVFVIADGMGGCPAGEVASQIAVDVLAEKLAAGGANRSSSKSLRLFNQAFQDANSQVLQFGRTHDCLGMGAAVVAAVRAGNRIDVANVGDCRAYRFRGRRLQQLTRDETMAAMVRRTSLLDPQQLDRLRFKNLLVRCIGANPLEPSSTLQTVHLQPGDRLVLCSDGLANALEDPVIETTLLTYETAQEATSHLRQFAMVAGARDDTTCIVIDANGDRNENESETWKSCRGKHSRFHDRIQILPFPDQEPKPWSLNSVIWRSPPKAPAM